MSHTFTLPYFSDVTVTGPDKPRILWDNLMMTETATVTASSNTDPVDYPYQNAYDGLAFNYWFVEAGTQYLTFHFGVAVDVNAYAYYSPGDETLQNLGGTFQLQHSNDGASWSDFLPAETPTDSTPIYRSEDSVVTATWWRWKFVCASDFYVSVLSFGVDFTFERGCWVGFSPPILARDTTLTNNVSQGGNWLGRSIIRNGSSFSFMLDFLTPTFVRSYWYDFAVWAEKQSWFLLWNKTEFPYDACFSWAKDGKIDAPTYSSPNYMKTGMKVQGRTD